MRAARGEDTEVQAQQPCLNAFIQSLLTTHFRWDDFT